MNKNRLIVSLVGAVAAASSVLGWLVYFFRGDVSGLSWPFVWIGIFTWDDGMILGTFLFAGCVALWFLNSAVWTGLFFSSYALFRSFIEAFYNLNAQFSSTTRPWESYLPQLASSLHLRVLELFVIAQIFYTAVAVVSFLVLLFSIKKYFSE
jgi:hypothetical protein